MRKYLLFPLLLVLSSFAATSQTTGDYRSAASGNWNVAATWQRYDGATWVAAVTPPSSADGVITILNTHTVTVNFAVTVDQVVVDNGGTLALTGSGITIADGGDANDLTVNGAFTHSAGAVLGTGHVLINGSATWTGGFIDVTATTIGATGTMTINATGDARLLEPLTNNGTINWTNGAFRFNGGILTNNAAFNISNTAGNIENFSSGTFTNSTTGTITKTSAGTTTQSVIFNNNGTFQINGGNFTNSSTFTNTGLVSFSNNATFQNSSTMNFNAGSSVGGTGNFNQSGGTLSFSLALNVVATIAINFSGGAITGTGSVTTNGQFNWTSGNLNCSTTLTATAVMTINATGDVRVQNTLTNNGTINWTNGAFRFNGGTFTNNASFTISNTAGHIENFSTGTFTNSATGTVTKTTTGVNATNSSNITINNNGTIMLNSGTLVNLSTFTNTGSIAFTATTILQNVGTMNFNAGTSLSGTGSFNQTGGTTNFNLALALASTITINFSGGAIAGSGSLTINGNINWTNGNLNCSTTLNATATMTINATGDVRLLNALVNGGTINWTNGAFRFNGGTLTNNAAFNITNTSGNIENFSSGTFTNSATGTVTKSTAGTNTQNITFNNNGAFQLNSGTFTNSSIFTNTGSVNFTNDAILSNSITMNFNTGSSVSGTGSINQTGGTMSFNMALNIIATITINFSGGAIAGSGSITDNGAFNWTNGNLNCSTTLNATATMTINATGDVRLLNTLVNSGTINWTNGAFRFNGGTLTNNAAFNITNTSGNIENFSSGTFTNSATGTVTKSTAGTNTQNITFNNNGAFQLNSGTFANSSVFTNTGAVNFTNDAILSNSITMNFNTGSSVSGTGSINQTGGTMSFNMALNIIATITINFSGGAIAGSGSITDNGAFNWTNGNLNCPTTLSATAIMTINATGDVRLLNTLNNNGTINWTNGAFRFNGGSLMNDAAFNIMNTALNMENFSVASFINSASGIITKSTTGTTVVSINLANSGVLKGVGTLNFTGTYSSIGIIAPGLSTGTLTFNGSEPFSGSSTLSIEVMDGSGVGTGHDQLQRAGNLMLGGTLTVVETGIVPAGTYTIISLSSGTISGTFSTVNLPPDYILNAPGPTTVTITKGGAPCAASVSIDANPGNVVCAGTNVIFTATPTNGGTPTYQWKLNGNNAGTNSNTYQNSSLVNGDIVTCQMTSSLACANPPISTSNSIMMTVNASVTPAVSIAANPGNTICTGTSVTFTATPVNGGTSPSYQWKLNGNNTGTNSNTYQNASLANGDIVSCVMTSNANCASPSTATSNNIVMTVSGAVTPAVSIAANPGNTICAGTNVTFTATPANGGATPSYQWKLNGNNVGTNSNTYQNASLANDDVVSCVMTSSLACASPSTATSNNIIMTVNPVVVPSVSIAASPGNTICSGTNVTFTATPANGGASPSYQWKLNGNNAGTNSNTYQNASLANGDVVSVIMTSSANCASPATATSNNIVMTVTATVVPAVSIAANPGNTICTGTSVTFTATPVNGGTSPSYQWKLNGNNTGTNSNTYQNPSLSNGDIVSCVMTSNANCAGPSTATSNNIVMTVSGAVTPAVSIAANPGNTICTGTNVTFTATPANGGATPSYQWKLNGNNVGTNSNTYQNASLANDDVVSCVMSSSLACASPSTATSNNIIMTVNPVVVPSVSIAASPGNTICSGTNVTFTATPTNGGASPSYQWKLNGNNAGTNSNTYQNASLANGDVVSVIMTSNANCASPATATSNTIVMAVTATVVPAVSIAANPGNTICTGTNVTFTATPVNGGATPSYQWKLNGNNTGTNSNTYQNPSLSNGDIVSCVMTSNANCASPSTATSNNIVMTVSGAVTPAVSIAANPGNTICAGTNVTFTATPANGGATPSYQWKLNGNNVGTNSNTYQNASLANDDVVSCVMTSSLACASPSTATSNNINMTVNPVVVPSVSIAASPGNTICSGTNVTFTATPANGGASPSYQWKLNGNNAGTNSNTYQNASLANGDVVSVIMTSSANCASPATATSNNIVMTVTATVVPAVSIAANPGNTICTGTSVTFTATPVNGGASPSYQWKLNGNNAGTNSNTYQNASLANGDIVSCVMTSNANCTSPSTATSNNIVMTVSGAVTPAVSIAANPGNTICTGTNVTFTATPANGGATPSYQWKLNGNNVGINSNTYQNASLANDDVVSCVMSSSLACASPSTATSNNIVMTVTVCTGTDNDDDGYTIEQGDCNDTNAAIHPGAPELCDNGVDENCNGYVDENCLPNLPVLTLRTYPVKEGDLGITMLNVDVKLDKAAPVQLQINYATVDEDATSGLDYTPTNGILILPAGATSGTVQVGIIGDGTRENNERFRINFTNPINVVIVGDPFSRIMIIDDDKGRPIVEAAKGENNGEIAQQVSIPNIVKRNQVWNLPSLMLTDNTLVIADRHGKIIFAANNYRNNTSVPNVSSGIYFYQVIYRNEKGQIIRCTGKLFITE